MDQRDSFRGYQTFYYNVYEGGELSQGYLCGQITVYSKPSDDARNWFNETSPRALKEMLLRGCGEYTAMFEPRPSLEPIITVGSQLVYTSPEWGVHLILHALYTANKRRGPFQAIMCSTKMEL